MLAQKFSRLKVTWLNVSKWQYRAMPTSWLSLQEEILFLLQHDVFLYPVAQAPHVGIGPCPQFQPALLPPVMPVGLTLFK